MNQSKTSHKSNIVPVKQIICSITSVFAKMLTFIQRCNVETFAIEFKLSSTSQSSATFRLW